MSPKPPALVCILHFWASVMRFLGGFPYTWDEYSDGAVFPALRPRKGLQLWSYFMTITQIVFIVFTQITFYFLVNPRPASSEGTTQQAMTSVIYVIELATASVLSLHLCFAKGQLFVLISELDSCFPWTNMHTWKISRNKGLIVLQLSQATYSITVCIYCISYIRDHDIVEGILVFIAAIYFYSVIIPVAFLTVYIICSLPKHLLSGILEMFDSDMVAEDTEKYSHHVAQEKNNCWVKSNTSRRDAGSQSASELVCRMHKCQLLMNEYLTPLVSALLTFSVSWMITDVYRYTTTPGSQEHLPKFLFYLTYNINNVIILCCTPSMLKDKVFILLGLVAVIAADSAPRYAYRAPSDSSEESYESSEAQYNFNWAVSDDSSSNEFGHQEARDGDDTQGSYYVQLPDGRLQRVSYHVDGDDGYIAEVSYEGEARFDSVESAESYEYRPRYSYDSNESK